jgi:hypothetical protein
MIIARHGNVHAMKRTAAGGSVRQVSCNYGY